ncbi:MAG TPA: polyphosphate kinase 2 family protein [Acidimicrobiales bacterium]|jgi:PPK2 family polyphosphate:nucleotide phosphotransferase|nr:polyphosphate kinase 2 family protein [Acidimicrobiales bacterium]
MAKGDSGRWRVAPGTKVDLGEIDTRSTDGAPGDKADTQEVVEGLHEELAGLQERLYAEGERSLLVVLQAIDAGGKDGTIKHVFRGLNPAGSRVVSFKVPSEEERSHDFLWRAHAKVPGKGEVVVFNRSHYEDVLVVRVHDLVPEKVWRPRYEFINDFEANLAAAGTRIVKLYLHISKEEQAERFRARLDDPSKRWKFRTGDLEERKRWDDYIAAFEEAIGRTSTDHAPWYVIPADRKWYRNWAISRILIETLEDMGPQYPPAEDLSGVEVV